MGQIELVLARAARRLFFTRAIRLLVIFATAAIAAATLTLILSRLGVIAELTPRGWGVFAAIGGGLVLVTSIIAALATAPKRDAVARQVDEAAGLKESLSTALYLKPGAQGAGGADDAWSSNVMETASRAARGTNLGASMPVRAPEWWWAPGVAALTMLIAWVALPQMDVLGKKAKQEQIAAKKEEVAVVAEQAKAATKKAESKLEEAMKKLGEEPLAEAKKEELPKPTTPEEIRRAAMKQLTSMQDKLSKLKLSERAQTAQAMSDKMKQLRTTPGPLEEFSKELAKGNVTGAEAALEAMVKNMSAGRMDNAQVAAAAKQLENMAKQLKSLAEDKKKLEEQLAKNGLDPKLASNPSALQQALKDSSLSKEQQEAMKNAAQAQQNASEAMQALAQACQNMAQQCQNPGDKPGQQGQQGQSQAQAMQDMQNALSQMEMAQADMQSMEAAMSEAAQAMKEMAEGQGQCNNPGMGEGQGNGAANGMAQGNGAYDQGDPTQGQGGGRGGPGISQGGGGVGEQEDIETWQKRKVRSPLGQGPMIGTMLVQGEQIKGESRAQLIEMTEAAAQQATEALENNTVPRELQDPIKRYFGRLAAKVKGQEKSAVKVIDEKKDETKTDEKK